MGAKVVFDTPMAGVTAALDLSTVTLWGANRTIGGDAVELEFHGATLPQGLSARFSPTDATVLAILNDWATTGELNFPALEKAVDEDRLGQGEVTFGNLDLPYVAIDKR